MTAPTTTTRPFLGAVALTSLTPPARHAHLCRASRAPENAQTRPASACNRGYLDPSHLTVGGQAYLTPFTFNTARLEGVENCVITNILVGPNFKTVLTVSDAQLPHRRTDPSPATAASPTPRPVNAHAPLQINPAHEIYIGLPYGRLWLDAPESQTAPDTQDLLTCTRDTHARAHTRTPPHSRGLGHPTRPTFSGVSTADRQTRRSSGTFPVSFHCLPVSQPFSLIKDVS